MEDYATCFWILNIQEQCTNDYYEIADISIGSINATYQHDQKPTQAIGLLEDAFMTASVLSDDG